MANRKYGPAVISAAEARRLFDLLDDYMIQRNSRSEDSIQDVVVSDSFSSVWDGDTSIRSGRISGVSYKYMRSRVGVCELNDVDDSLSIAIGVAPIVSHIHESCGHWGQWHLESKKDTDLSCVIMTNYFACQCSKFWYGFDDDGNVRDEYYDQPHEIAAQYVAIRGARDFLSMEKGQEWAESAVLAYCKHRADKGCMEVGADFSSVDSVLDYLNQKFRESLGNKKPYGYHISDVDFSDSMCPGNECDWFHAFAYKTGNARILKAVDSCGSRMDQDRMLAYAFLSMVPTARIDAAAMPSLAGKDRLFDQDGLIPYGDVFGLFHKDTHIDGDALDLKDLDAGIDWQQEKEYHPKFWSGLDPPRS